MSHNPLFMQDLTRTSAKVVLSGEGTHVFAYRQITVATANVAHRLAHLLLHAKEVRTSRWKWEDTCVLLARRPVADIPDQIHMNALIHGQPLIPVCHQLGCLLVIILTLNRVAGGGCVFPIRGNRASGTDCSIINGVENVRCINAKCVVMSCETGWHVTADGQSCTTY